MSHVHFGWPLQAVSFVSLIPIHTVCALLVGNPDDSVQVKVDVWFNGIAAVCCLPLSFLSSRNNLQNE
ncbi:hypothetical protein B0H14DRAFT_2750639 [Mycena olivaceomarginata]|nr:hypothetical protein B0H14DRAFT_2750639 [Mycena olivaceomarginata]